MPAERNPIEVAGCDNSRSDPDRGRHAEEARLTGGVGSATVPGEQDPNARLRVFEEKVECPRGWRLMHGETTVDRIDDDPLAVQQIESDEPGQLETTHPAANR